MPQSFRNWAVGYARKRLDGSQVVSAPIVTTLEPARPRGVSVPFIGLAEAYIVAAFTKAGLPMQRIRPAVLWLQDHRGARAAVPPGTGKTSLVEAAFPDLITVAGDGDTTVGDFLGEYTQRPDGSCESIYGPLIRAMLEGRVLFTDDATLISPAVLAVAYPAMDGRREVIVKARKTPQGLSCQIGVCRRGRRWFS